MGLFCCSVPSQITINTQKTAVASSKWNQLVISQAIKTFQQIKLINTKNISLWIATKSLLNVYQKYLQIGSYKQWTKITLKSLLEITTVCHLIMSIRNNHRLVKIFTDTEAVRCCRVFVDQTRTWKYGGTHIWSTSSAYKMKENKIR